MKKSFKAEVKLSDGRVASIEGNYDIGRESLSEADREVRSDLKDKFPDARHIKVSWA